jgi:conjugal transfer pilus assembly protein TraA
MFTSIKKMNGETLAIAAVMGLVVMSVAAPESALAGTGGTEFDTVWTTLTDWMQGTLGKIAAGAMILVGIIAGVARQSLMAFAVGIGGGVGLYNTPTIVDNVMTATLEHAPTATQAAISISNGLGM